MVVPLLVGVLQILPELVKTGFSVAALVNHTNSVAQPASPVETFASHLMSQLPGLISSGVDIYPLVTAAAARVSTMQKENRAPTPADWDDLHTRLTALDASYDKAAAPRS